MNSFYGDCIEQLIAFVSLIVAIVLIVLLFDLLVFGSFINNNNFCAYNYDYQSGETFFGNYSSISYNVYVLNQSDSLGKGPGYLLNGLTNKGYWYQVGVGYNWSRSGTEYTPGFSILTYLEFKTVTNVTSVYNSIHNGDEVLLSMNLSEGNVVLEVHDWNTNFTNITRFPAFNASYFVGGPYENGTNNDTANFQGHFTGLMTERIHVNIDSKAEAPIVYEPYVTNYNKTQLFVHNVGPLETVIGGEIGALECSLDIYNYGKQDLSQIKTSGVLNINTSTSYNFTPFNNQTIQIIGNKFITK